MQIRNTTPMKGKHLMGTSDKLRPHSHADGLCYPFVPSRRAAHVTYEGGEVDDLRLAYAMSVPKAQGSECAVVIMPSAWTLYHASAEPFIRRPLQGAKKQVYLAGSKKAIQNGRHERPDAQALLPSCRTAAWGTSID